MTREELETIRSTVKRSDDILRDLEILEAAKKRNLSLAVKPIADWNTADEILSKAMTFRLLQLGIETLICQLEQELADISVGPKPTAPPDVHFTDQLDSFGQSLLSDEIVPQTTFATTS